MCMDRIRKFPSLLIISVLLCTTFLSPSFSNTKTDSSCALEDLIRSAKKVGLSAENSASLAQDFGEFCRSAQILAGLKTVVSRSDANNVFLHLDQSYLLPKGLKIELKQKARAVIVCVIAWHSIEFPPLIRPPRFSGSARS